MADNVAPSLPASDPARGRFGAGLSESEVRRLQRILQESGVADMSMPKAWSCAIELMSLVELVLDSPAGAEAPSSTGFALPPS